MLNISVFSTKNNLAVTRQGLNAKIHQMSTEIGWEGKTSVNEWFIVMRCMTQTI